MPAHPFSEQDKEKVIDESLPFIKYTAFRLGRRLPPQLSVHDLIHVGIIGLLESLERYRSGSVKLRTFVEYRIRGAMLDELRSQDPMSRSLRDKTRRIRKARRRLEAELGRTPDDEQVANSANMTLDEYYRTLQQASNAVVFSFEDFRERAGCEGDRDVLECLCDSSAGNPLQLLEEAGDREALTRAIQALSEKEQLVLSLYYWDELTMKEIGKVMGLSEGRICQIHNEVLRRLKNNLCVLSTPASRF